MANIIFDPSLNHAWYEESVERRKAWTTRNENEGTNSSRTQKRSFRRVYLEIIFSYILYRVCSACYFIRRLTSWRNLSYRLFHLDNFSSLWKFRFVIRIVRSEIRIRVKIINRRWTFFLAVFPLKIFTTPHLYFYRYLSTNRNNFVIQQFARTNFIARIPKLRNFEKLEPKW